MKYILMLLMATMSAGAMAAWEQVSKNSEENSYIDPATILADGKFRKAWALRDLKKRNKDGVMSVQALEEYDCQDAQYRILALTTFSARMTKGNTLITIRTPHEKFQSIPADSRFDFHKKFVCGE
jgi:hypothetical protein